jgi:hypothetical protein
VNGEITAHFSTDAGTLGLANLTDDNLAGFDLFATIELHPEALARTVMNVFGGTAGFDM